MTRLRIHGRPSPTLAADGQGAQSHPALLTGTNGPQSGYLSRNRLDHDRPGTRRTMWNATYEGKVIAVYGFLDKVPAAQQRAQFVAAVWRGAIEISSIFGAVLARSAAPTPLLPE